MNNQLQKNELPPQIGKYTILERLGAGGLGEVFKALDPATGEIVALKRLHQKFQKNKKLLGLFHKETMIQANVSHKHCVSFIEASLEPNNAYIVTEFIDGFNCHKLLRLYKPIPPLICAAIMIDMLQGLEHLHCLDIVHSDITPSNVLLDKSGRVVLADFGLSAISEVDTYEGIQLGTPGYQAPERLREKAVTPQTDIYCAGILLWELLRGEHLFVGLEAKAIVQRMKQIPLSWIETGNQTLDRFLKETLSLALQLEPTQRFPTPRDFMFAVYQCLKLQDVRYPKRAIYQWMCDKQLVAGPPLEPLQNIY